MIVTFPWHTTSKPHPNGKYTALLGLVQLSSPLLLPTFIQFGIRIDRQLKRSPGVVGYRTAANPLNLTFYHLSAWEDVGAIHTFVHTEPHLAAMQKLTGRLGETVFKYWDITGGDLPLQTGQELHRLGGTAPVA